MSEAELWELLNAYNSAALTALALYLTTASSFLVAAYNGGKPDTLSNLGNFWAFRNLCGLIHVRHNRIFGARRLFRQ